MLNWATKHLKETSPESYSRFNVIAKKPNILDNVEELRSTILDFIADFAIWENGSSPDYLETARRLTQIAHETLGGTKGTHPLVMDPFAGGASIPVEAARVAAEVFASDINPVAVLLTKVALEYIPKFEKRLPEEVRRWGRWVQAEAVRELSEFYPKDTDGATPIAYLWARTVRCEGPGCGSEVPLIRSFWLTKKSSRTVGFRLVPNPEKKRIDFEIIDSPSASYLGQPTVRRGSATCPLCGFTTPVVSVRRQLKAIKGGANQARLFCVARVFPDKQGRFYRAANDSDLDVVTRVRRRLEERKAEHSDVLSLIPNEPTPQGGGSGAGRAFSQRNYGMDVFEDLFTFRQALALSTFATAINKAPKHFVDVSDLGLVTAIETVLALNLSKLVDISTSLGAWEPNIPTVQHLFGRQAIGMCWDFAEGVTIGEGRGSWINYLEKMADILELQVGSWLAGHAEQQDASKLSLPDDSAQMFFTDPPYYDAVPYADLSDLFYVWLKRALRGYHEHLFRSKLTPKVEECILDEVKGKDSTYFERKMLDVMTEGRRVLEPSGIGILVFAHKSTAGWEAQLQAMVDAGWVITASWPIDTENASRLRAQSSAALASSIHIVCRPRENPDGSVCRDEIGDWREVLAELPNRIHEWMPRLAKEGIVGADAIFACIGPALEIYSRYSSVEKASGERVMLKEYLEEVWAAVSREALSMIFDGADASGFEEDARLTAMWLWTLRNSANGNSFNEEDGEEEENEEEAGGGKKKGVVRGYILEYDAARKIAQGLGAHLETLGHLVEVKGDTATLLAADARAQYLFGKDAGKTPNRKRERKKVIQGVFDFLKEPGNEDEGGEGKWSSEFDASPGKTVLDQLHQSMLLFAAGRSEALKRFLVEDRVGSKSLFWRLAQALSALYPPAADEKRWVDGVLARKKGLGF